MFHDLGLTERYRTSTVRFEVDGANAARDFLLERGVDPADAAKVWLAIALHTTRGCPSSSIRRSHWSPPESKPT